MNDREQIGPPGNNPVEGGGATTQTHLQWLIKSNDSLRDDIKRIESKLDAHAEIFRQQALISGQLQADMKHLITESSKQKDSLSKLEGEFSGLKYFIAGCAAIIGLVLPMIWFLWGDKLSIWFKSIV